MNFQFNPVIYIIFEIVKTRTGKSVILNEKDDLAGYAMIKIARKNMDSHLLYYKPEHSGIINHLVAHECGHILRIYDTPDNKRLIPFTNDNYKRIAFSSIEPDIQKLSQQIPFDNLVSILNMWYTGLIRQLTSYPSDIMIEKWIYKDYPELRPYQEMSLKKQYDEAVMGMSQRVEKITPLKILEASNGMNYAFFNIISNLLNDISFSRKYTRSAYEKIGRQLVLIQQDAKDNYQSDINITNKWADYLNISDWFSWKDFEDIPGNYMNTF